MFRMRRTLIAAALLVLVTACAAPPPASSATTVPLSASTTPASTPTASPSPTVPATAITLPSTAQLSAPSGTVVWAFVADSRLFRSTDRGDTWQDRSAALPGYPNREIEFVSDTDGWLAIFSSATQCQNQSVGITHTTDGGAKWDPLTIAGVESPADPPGTGGPRCKERLVLTDAQRGFLSAFGQDSAPVIYRTSDGGRTWSASTLLPIPPGFTIVPSGAFLRAERVRAFGGTRLVLVRTSDGRASYVFRSDDGGATWSYLVTVPQGEGAFAFVTATRWLQIGAPGSSKETTDGGATWHALTTDYSQAAPIAPEIVFADPLVGYATARGGIQRTIDGGAHWVGITTPGT
jgi:photosystem II stability/assembly factor-like uncharacterized protein